ncbi:glycosyltransferase [Vitreimonas sp.]|uniref:glycosyltransferase n=1 Tax=Vitreimonas sp. TaxID=3069702 RepID=UPI002ED9D7CD
MARRLRLNLSRRAFLPSADEDVWDSEVIRARLRGSAALGALLRYEQVVLSVDSIDELLTDKPILAARSLARSHAQIEDLRGQRRLIGWVELPRIALRAVSSVQSWRAAHARLSRDLLAVQPRPARRLGDGDGALVVRPDLWFGLEAGGAVAHTAGMLNALARRVLPLRLLTSHDVPTLSPVIERVQVSWRRYPKPEWALLAFNAALVDAGKRLPRPRFVYQRHSLYGYAGATLARHFDVPLVLEYNGSEVWVGDHWGVPPSARDIALEIEAKMLSAADLVTTVSRPLMTQAAALGASRDRLLLCPNAVDPERYTPQVSGAGVRQRYGLGDSIVIAFIGTFGAWHGANLLAEAFCALKRQVPSSTARLLMIGDGPQRGTAERIIEDAGFAGSATFTGLVPQDEGPAHLAAADILVSPTVPNPDGSEFFGSPTKLFEYMAMGRAIVASDLAQLAEVLAHDRTALLTPAGDAAALAGALQRLCGDEGLRRRLGEAAREESVAKHTWAQRVEALTAAVNALT